MSSLLNSNKHNNKDNTITQSHNRTQFVGKEPQTQCTVANMRFIAHFLVYVILKSKGAKKTTHIHTHTLVFSYENIPVVAIFQSSTLVSDFLINDTKIKFTNE